MIRREKIHLVVDDATIAAGEAARHPGDIIQPVWWSVDIYNGPVAYELSLKPFSNAQRLVHAMIWYVAEVCNGGHSQFYSNSTGILWSDALKGFEAIGMDVVARIIKISAERLGGSPSFDRQERNDQLAAMNPDFEDLDDAFFKLQERESLYGRMMDYVRTKPSDFFFSGMIERIVLPTIPPTS